MRPSQVTQLICTAAVFALVIVQFTAHEGPRKDWITIGLAAIVLVLGITTLTLRRREQRAPSDHRH